MVTSRLLCFKDKCVQTSLGFIPDIHRIMCKYQLLSHVTEFFNTSRFPSKDTWKRIVKKSVFDFEESKWQAQILSSPDICHFWKLHPNLKMYRAWHISRLNTLLKEQVHHVISICVSWRPMSSEGVCSLWHSKYSDLLIRSLYVTVNT